MTKRENTRSSGKNSKNSRSKGKGLRAIRLATSLKSVGHRQSLRQMAQGWEQVSDAISVTDPETNKLWYINPAWRQLYGFTFKQALDEPASILNPGGLPAKKQQTILARTRNGGWSGRLMNQDAKGNTFAVDLRTQCLLNTEGEVMGLLGLATSVRRFNVSDKKIQQLVEQHESVLTRELKKLVETVLVMDEPAAHVVAHNKNDGREQTEVLGIGRLSKRELEIFTLIGRGLGTREIGEKLSVSAYTVQTHRNHIKDKLNLPDSAAITYWAFQWVNGN